ncbi:MAG TPA: fimbria/pilus periplasmic chaperone [Buttiauxella sp.]|jgi:P pilus assembly chaperone PapD
MTLQHFFGHRLALTLAGCLLAQGTQAALSLDRSRIVFNEGEKSVSLSVRNLNDSTPFLVQSWLEDAKEEKINGPLMALPPLQRIDADSKSVVRLQALTDITTLPKDRESLFYFNLREIPPKSEKSNTLTLALQTRIKVFYRPAALKVDPVKSWVPGMGELTLEKKGDSVEAVNPGAYHVTFVGALKEKALVKNFDAVMVPPKGRSTLSVKSNQLGNNPALVFINDYGGQLQQVFHCSGTICKAGEITEPELKKPVESKTEKAKQGETGKKDKS